MHEVDSLDIPELLASLWKGKSFIIKAIVISSIFGVLVAFLIQNKYVASTTFIPQYSSDQAPSGLGGIAALAGINLSSLGGSKEIPPNLYPNIMVSLPFRLELLDEEVVWEGEKYSFREYLNMKNNGVLDSILEFIMDLPNLLRKSNKNENTKSSSDIIVLSEDDYDLMLLLDKSIEVSLNEKEGYVVLSVKDESPVIAAQIANAAGRMLQGYIINFKIRESQDLLDFTNRQWGKFENELYALQDSLAAFKEQNMDITSLFIQNSLMRLETKSRMINEVYNELAIQKAQAELQVQKDTPVFQIIDPVSIPNKKSEPKRVVILMLFFFVSLIMSSLWILVRHHLKKLILDIRDK